MEILIILKRNYNVIFLTILTVILIQGIVSNAPEVLGHDSSRSSDIQLVSTIQFANYTDWDGDQFEDDIYILLVFDFISPISTAITSVDITITLELPSGTILTGSLRVSVYTTDQIITLYILDSATEAGWYTVTSITTLTGSSKSEISISQYIFDPPTGKGNGLPE